MTDILNAINNLFKTVFEAYLKSPSAFLVVIIALFCAYMTLNNNSILNKALTPVSAEQDRFKQVIMLNSEIPNRLEVLRNNIGADRILIRQFHNGKQGISGIPFTFVQTTYAVTAPGRGLVDEAAWMSYPISTMSNSLNMMFDPKTGFVPHCVYLDRNQVPDDLYRALFTRYGVIDMIKCPLSDKDGNVVGLIVATWTTPLKDAKKIPNYEISMARTGKVVVEKLGTIDKNEEPWWKIWA